MPISPKEVEAYVHSSDDVDAIIKFIDETLGSAREKYYRHGSWDDYFFHVDAVGQLTSLQKDELRRVYLNVGWPIVQVYTCQTDPGKTTVRLFVHQQSQFTHTDVYGTPTNKNM